MVAIYIGVTLDDINIGNKGWGIVLGWNLWILLKDILEVVLVFCFKKTRSNCLVEKGRNRTGFISCVLMFCFFFKGESYAVNDNGLSPENAVESAKGVSLLF